MRGLAGGDACESSTSSALNARCRGAHAHMLISRRERGETYQAKWAWPSFLSSCKPWGHAPGAHAMQMGFRSSNQSRRSGHLQSLTSRRTKARTLQESDRAVLTTACCSWLTRRLRPLVTPTIWSKLTDAVNTTSCIAHVCEKCGMTPCRSMRQPTTWHKHKFLLCRESESRRSASRAHTRRLTSRQALVTSTTTRVITNDDPIRVP